LKRILSFLFFISICLAFFSSCSSPTDEGFSIVAVNFPAYDFAKNIVGDKGTVTLLLPPGGESHTYEPTAKDVIRISECDLFIYTGGENDVWIEDILSSLDKKPQAVKMMDFVEIHHEEEHEHTDSHSHKIDEHIWTSLKNSVKIISGLSEHISAVDSKNAKYYHSNAETYINKINRLDKDFEEMFKNAKRNTIVVADRFPFTYFVNDYGLKHYSAYHSCSEDAEPTPKIIAELIDTVNNEKIPLIFHLEFSNKTVATAVSEDTGAELKELHSCHNITKQQLDDGVTYLDLMKQNYKTLKEAVYL